jgi:hypothetical protein
VGKECDFPYLGAACITSLMRTEVRVLAGDVVSPKGSAGVGIMIHFQAWLLARFNSLLHAPLHRAAYLATGFPHR